MASRISPLIAILAALAVCACNGKEAALNTDGAGDASTQAVADVDAAMADVRRAEPGPVEPARP